MPKIIPLIKKVDFDIQGASGESALAIVAKLKKRGFQTYVAGGAVRDLLLGGIPKDYDVVTEARPEEVLKIFTKKQKVGLAFGVILVHDYQAPVEVATFRSDGDYSDGRRPDSVEFGDVQSDALRRDFTVNGLYYDPEKSEVIDYIKGLDDLDKKSLRAIGEARERFAEDYLRLLRAIRFSVRLGFDLEEKTWQAVCENSGSIAKMAKDRIHSELKMIFSLGRGDEAHELMQRSGLLKAIFSKQEMSLCLPKFDLICSNHFSSSMALMLSLSRSQGQLLNELAELRFSNQEKREVMLFIKNKEQMDEYSELDIPNRKRLLRMFSRDELLYYASRSGTSDKCLKEMVEDLNRWSRENLDRKAPLNGDDLLKAGFKSGPFLGKCIHYVESLSLEDKIKSREDAFVAIREHPEFSKYLS